MKKIVILLIAVLVIGCNLSNRSYNKITIAPADDSTKVVFSEMHSVDTIAFVVPNVVPDSIILAGVKQYTDSLKQDSIRRDSLQKVNFRQITRIINGGYNGYADRVRLWENAKKALKSNFKK